MSPFSRGGKLTQEVHVGGEGRVKLTHYPSEAHQVASSCIHGGKGGAGSIGKGGPLKWHGIHRGKLRKIA